MAPEAMESANHELSVKGDVWAFGMTALVFTLTLPCFDVQRRF